ncbi:MAG: glycoside hydrolase family 3 domain protein [Gemmatimonadetes bacterium]|nr:glycoside hydrolase family 3 domain protein [Gemmatimonadota bacterium]
MTRFTPTPWRTRRAACAFLGALLLCVAPAGAQEARVSVLPAERVEALIRALTVPEKLSMIRGGMPGVMGPSPADPIGEVGYMPGVARLGIPPLRLTDGPAGIRVAPATTALPAPVSLAATFSEDLASQYGRVLGREARAMRQDVLFGPMMNIVRVPQGGRNFETLGEDPFLAARMAVAQIRAIQAEGVIATAKHFAANNQEAGREFVDAKVDERTLHEIELPAFEASVRAGVGSVMCAYNQVNGLFGCENPGLLTNVLRDRWRFDGFVVSDYGATHTSGASLRAGLDVEFLSEHFATIGDSLRTGSMPVWVLDWAVRHILTAMNRFGLLAGASPTGGRAMVRAAPAMDVAASARVAREVATQGAVLLENRGALPLTPHDLQSLVVIGPSARRLLVGGGGSSRVAGVVAREQSPLAALRAGAGAGAGITYEPGIELDGVAVPAEALVPEGAPGQHGLRRTTTGTSATQVDATIDYTGARALPQATRATWSGTLLVPSTGVYDLALQTDWGIGPFLHNPAGNSSIVVDGQEVVSNAPFVSRTLSLIPTTTGLTNATARLRLTAGPHTVRIVMGVPAYFSGKLAPQPLQVRFAWVTPSMRAATIGAAARAARSARAAVVFVHNEGSEGVDRESLALPLGQDDLVAAVVAANPRTVVVLNTGDPVLMPWATRANAILEMWYPGQEGGAATADLLLGRASPGGRLPVTFPLRATDAPTAAPERYPGIRGIELYSEGVFVGYRWYDEHGIAPRYAFGHGRSYTTFRYSGLVVVPRGDGFDVSFRVRNVGSRAGAEVPQVYVSRPDHPPAPMPPRALAGFTRVMLAPGEERALTVHVGERALSWYSVSHHDWAVAPGARAVFVGASSRDLRLRGVLSR